ncbi:hypothetical protein [Pseudosulfitobacter sp. SM2401]|uniref:hypothetical protein n=1 Tax=Pseudosulfitobacter sp. SM2401 TaxID=3350098 RepID=UPI0036F1FA5F
MTATSEFMPTQSTPLGADTFGVQSAPAHALDGSRLVVRATQAFIGAVLILAAVGLWAMPGADWSGDLLLIKLVLSLMMVLGGIAMLHTPNRAKTPEIEIDTIRREVRVMRRNEAGDQMLSAHKFADLERAELLGAHMILWAKGDVMLAEVAMSDPNIRRSLTSAMMQAGKL